MDSTQSSVWSGHSRQWDLVGAPLTPTPDDGALLLHLLESCLRAGKPTARLAVLGVTPQVIQLPWPSCASIHAFDHSSSMIERVWRPNPRVQSTCALAPWQSPPISDGFFDAICGDGSLNCLPTQEEYVAIFAELARVSKADAAMAIRCFTRPDEGETLDAVRHATMSGSVGSFHSLKWRIAMSVAGNDGVVAVQSIYNAFEASFDRNELSNTTGWPLQVINTIDAYRGVATAYTFPTLGQWQKRCQPYWRVDQVLYAQYELADCCPTLRFVRETGVA
jgi:hypothetical protein